MPSSSKDNNTDTFPSEISVPVAVPSTGYGNVKAPEESDTVVSK